MKWHKLLFTLFILFQFYNLFSQSDRRENTNHLTVTTFNAEFLWDGLQPEEGQVDFSHKNNPQEAGEHMEDIAYVLRQVNADIVNIVEVEGIDALTKLNDDYLDGMGYKPYLIKGNDSYTGQDVGLLTRIDPETQSIERTDNRESINGLESGVSKNYFAKFNVNGEKIALVSLHLISRPSDQSRRDKREAQATVIKDLSLGLANQGYSLIVLGDFNDYDGDNCCSDHADNIPISTVLRIIKTQSQSTNADDLINVSQFIDKDERYTSHWDKNRNNQIDGVQEFSSIDHILISKGLESFVDTAFIYNEYSPLIVSDHFPVVVSLNMDTQSPIENSVRIVSLLPNPSGDETQNEQITLFNSSSNTITLTDWKVKDLAGNRWTINATIPANSESIIKRNGQKMSLNNRGDTIWFYDGGGTEIQNFTYQRADEGEIVLVRNL
jgi:exonuclease III